MEEILASIRRIIAEDDSGRPVPAPPRSAATPEPSATPAVEPPDEVEDRVDGFDDPETPSVAANDVFDMSGSHPPAFPRVEPDSAEQPRPEAAAESIRPTQWPESMPQPPRPASIRFERPKAPPAWPETAAAEPARPEPARPEPGRPEPSRAQPARPELANAESAWSDLARAESARLEAARSELAKFESARSESARFEPSRSESVYVESARPEPPRAEPTMSEATRPRPAGGAATPPAMTRASGDHALLSPRTSAAVDLAFNTLAQTVLVQNSRTLDDLVREMLKPMLKAWLDDNLPNMVERMVRAEIERVSRGRG